MKGLLQPVKTNLFYAFGSLANSAALFLLIPFLVNHFTPTEYGAWALSEVGNMLFGLLVLPGLEVGLMREYWFLAAEGEKKIINGTTLIFTLLWGGILFILGSSFTRLFQDHISFPGAPLTIILTLLSGYLDSQFTVLLTVFRIREEAYEFTILSIGRMALFVSGSILLVKAGYGFAGGLTGRVVATSLAVTLAVFLARQKISLSFSWMYLRRMVRYGLPLLPSRLTQYILIGSDRYILGRYSSLEIVGIYSFAYKIASGLDILITRPFSIDWGARRFKIATLPDAPRRYARVLVIFSTVSILAALFLWSLVPELYGWIAPEAYRQGIGVIPIILASYVILGLSYPLNIGIMLRDKTEYASIVGLVSAVLCVGLNFWLIPRYGMTGAAWATLISYISWTGGITFLSLRLYRVPYRLNALVILFVETVCGFAGLQFIDRFELEIPNFITILLKIVWLILVFGLSGLALLREEGIRIKRKLSTPDGLL